MKKRLLIVITCIIILLAVSALLLYFVAYCKYGFLFSIPTDQSYAIALAQYEKVENRIKCDYYDKSVPTLTREDTEALYRSLKNAKYKSVSPTFSHGELVRITLSKDKYSDQLDFVFSLLYEHTTDKLYLWWKNERYEVTDFDRGQHIIQYNAPEIATFGIMDEDEKTFFPMPYFSYSSNKYARNYEHNQNKEPVQLNNDEDIIEHAKKELSGLQLDFEETVLYREEHGDRYLAIFTYSLPEHNVRKRVFVLMSSDGITEITEHRLYHRINCL